MNTTNDNRRAAILGRVREALGPPTAHRPAPVAIEDPTVFKQWLPGVGESYEDRVESFAAMSEKLKTTFLVVPDKDAARGAIADIARQQEWTRVAMHGDPLVMECLSGLPGEHFSTDGGYDADELETCDAGVSACDALIAQMGSVLVTTHSAGGRALSVLPPHHVVVATRDQLIADLPDAFALLRQRYEGDWPTFMSIISGPSRTGDIERILVLGAHGPKKLTVVLIDG